MSIFKKDISKLSDEALMSRLQKLNDLSALALLYDRYSKRILGYLFKMFKGDEQKAQDLLQDVFIKVQEKKDYFDTSKKFYSWLFTLAHNTAKSSFREVLTIEMTEDNSPSINTTSQDNLEEYEVNTFLKNSVNKLDINHRTVLILRYHQEFSIKEISEITGANEGTVKSRLFYATKKLAEKYKIEFSINN